MKKNIYYIIGGIILIVLVVLAVNSFAGENLQGYTTDVVELYSDERYDDALVLIVEAKRKGFYDTNMGIIHGQVLVNLGRYEEARAQYELVKAEDASAVAAIDELIKEIAGL